MANQCMPYRDPRLAREAARAWRLANPELVRRPRKAATLRKALRERRIPRWSSITHFSDEELRAIVNAALCTVPAAQGA